MPNSPIDNIDDDKLDRKLSNLLNESEPPRSPQHLDESILGYAREQTEKNRQAVKVEKNSSPDRGWFRQRWMPAVATFSIAAIAVSVSLQDFGPDDFEPGFSDLASSSELALREDLPVLEDNPIEAREPAAGGLALQNVQPQPQDTPPQRPVSRAVAVAELIEEELEDQSQEPSVEQLDQTQAGTQVAIQQARQDLADVTTTSSPTLLSLDTPTPSALSTAQVTPATSVQAPTSRVETDADIPSSPNNANNSGANLATTTTPVLELNQAEQRSTQPDQASALTSPPQAAPTQVADSDETQARNQGIDEEESDTIANINDAVETIVETEEIEVINDAGADVALGSADVDAIDISAPEKPEESNAVTADNGVLANQQVQEVVVTGSFIRGDSNSAASAVVEVESTLNNAVLASVFQSDFNAQDNFIDLMEQLLNQSSQPRTISRGALSTLIDSPTSVFTRRRESVENTDTAELANRRQRLIELYGRLTEPGQYLSLANQYRQLRSADPDSPTPNTLESAIELLELLNQ